MIKGTYYLISRQDKWFNGVVSIHPGTAKRGHDVAQWDNLHAKPIGRMALSSIKAFLTAQGQGDFVVHTVTIERQ